MTDEELIARLRDCGNGVGSFKTKQGDYGLCDDAADRIEALVKKRDAALASNRGLVRLNEMTEARAERLEAAIRELKRCWYQGDLTENDFAAALKENSHE